LYRGVGLGGGLLNRDASAVLPAHNSDLVACLHAGDRIETEPSEHGGGVEAL
jgi:hypothetical protein